MGGGRVQLLLDNPWNCHEASNDVLFVDPDTFEVLRDDAKDNLPSADEDNLPIVVTFCFDEGDSDIEEGDTERRSCTYHPTNLYIRHSLADNDTYQLVKMVKDSGQPSGYYMARRYSELWYTFDNGTLMRFEAFVCRGRLFISSTMPAFLATIERAVYCTVY